MTDLEYRRRVMEAWGVSEDTFGDYRLGEQLSYYVGISGSSKEKKISLSPAVKVISGHSITLYAAGLKAISNNLQHGIYSDDDGEVLLDTRDVSPNPRTLTVSSTWKSVRCIFDFNYLADAYIKDNTDDVYLWKGSDDVQV